MRNPTAEVTRRLILYYQSSKSDSTTILLHQVEEAVRKYLDDQKWERTVTAGRETCQGDGIDRGDVPRLIEEVRSGNRTRGRVTAESDIYVSALTTGRGNPYASSQLARAGKISLAVSDAILDEVADALERKFGWPQEDTAEAKDQDYRQKDTDVSGLRAHNPTARDARLYRPSHLSLQTSRSALP